MAKLLLVFLFLASCGTSVKKTNDIDIGMSKNDVVEILGGPDNKRAYEGETYLVYFLKDKEAKTDKSEYVFVFDNQDKLTKFGKKGDFGTTEEPTDKVIIKERLSL